MSTMAAMVGSLTLFFSTIEQIQTFRWCWMNNMKLTRSQKDWVARRWRTNMFHRPAIGQFQMKNRINLTFSRRMRQRYLIFSFLININGVWFFFFYSFRWRSCGLCPIIQHSTSQPPQITTNKIQMKQIKTSVFRFNYVHSDHNNRVILSVFH